MTLLSYFGNPTLKKSHLLRLVETLALRALKPTPCKLSAIWKTRTTSRAKLTS